jgi:hypothetical protein
MARLTPECDDLARRALVAGGTLNGIDYLEVSQDQKTLRVFFLNPLPPAAYGLPANPGLVTVAGGVRTRNIQVAEVRRAGEFLLEVDVNTPGDFSTYTLLINSASLDPAYDQVDFSFKAACPNRFDCKPRHACPPEPAEEPVIDYLAKDYASFRQALLDFITTRKPDWKERHEADLGVAILEILAYAGDQISYNQDAVANEPYLDTARQRVSVRRHARLVDYHMHDGASARTWVHFHLDPGAAGTLPAETPVLTNLDSQLGALFPPFPAILPAAVSDLALASANAVFQTMHAVRLDSALNELTVYAWGNRQCCLPPGVTSVELVGDLTSLLQAGTFLLFEEVKGAVTGLTADADRTHRQVVRLEKVELTGDPLLATALTRITWGAADGLRFPLCLSTLLSDGTFVPDLTVARGNVALADHGRPREQWHPEDPVMNPGAQGIVPGARAYRFLLDEGSLSFRIPFDPAVPAALLETTDPAAAQPQVVKTSVYLKPNFPPLPPDSTWGPTPDLLASGPFATDFAVETDNLGQAQLRFGDNIYGQSPPENAFFYVEYRTGVGGTGNIGAEALAHTTSAVVPGITAIRNPLPAWGGADPEPLERVKRLAPAAFHAEQFRAVTEDDYARAAEKHPQVSKAVARFRWTGSWLTVFVTIDPLGGEELTRQLKTSVKNWLTRYTLAGYDLEIVAPRYIPLDIDLDVCVKRDHFKGDVEAALAQALSSGVLPGGALGFFHPDRFSFGQRPYLSALYAAAVAVQGVDSVNATRFRRQDEYDPDPGRPATTLNLDRGYIAIGDLEILRLNNDPNFPEDGRLRLNMMGGK